MHAPDTLIGRLAAEFRRYKHLSEGALDQLTDAELAVREDDNSVATIVHHIAGNLTSRFTDFLTTDGEKPWRDREGEFAERHLGADDLREVWERGWGVLLHTLDGLTDADLDRTVTIRGVPLRVDEALLRALAHMSYHVGQIVFVAKRLRGADWRSLSIPPGGTAAYNRNPTRETATAAVAPQPPAS
jgi:uncharacterized damage-inducible protein DinB